MRFELSVLCALAGFHVCAAYPKSMEPTCDKAQSVASGTAVQMHGKAMAPGVTMTATQNGVSLGDGGQYTPNAPITVASSAAGQYGIWSSAGTFAGGLCGGKMTETGGSLTAPASGPLTLVGMSASGFAAVSFQTIALTAGTAGGGAVGGVPPGGGSGVVAAPSSGAPLIPDAGMGLFITTVAILFAYFVARKVHAFKKEQDRKKLRSDRERGIATAPGTQPAPPGIGAPQQNGMPPPAPGAPPPPGQQPGMQPVYGQQPAYGQEPAYGQQPAYGQEPAYGQQPNPYGAMPPPPAANPWMTPPPSPPPPPPPMGQMSSGPSSDWVPQFDQTGRKFFWNRVTNEVSWDPPGMPAPAPGGYASAEGAHGYGTETVPAAPAMIQLDVIPDRRKTLSTEKAQMSDKELKFHRVADKRIPFLDVPLLEGILFGLYLLLNLMWATVLAAPTWILADSWGYLAACNGLFVVIPAARNSVWSWVFGLPFDKTITIHRWIGRLTAAEATAHLVLYVVNGMPPSLFFSVAKYRNGLVSWLSLVVIFVTSLEYLRRKKYNVFYAAHFSFLLFYLFAALHTPKFHFYAIAAILIYGFDKGQRFARGVLSTQKVARIELLANSDILRVSILKKWPINQPWAAPQLGQYVFLNFPEVSKWEWHPYTLASSPLEEHMEVNIKKLGDHTKQLVESCQNGDHPVVRVDGPYGKVIINPKRHRSLVMVSGGIGVTPMISMLRWYYLINTPAAIAAKQSVHLAEYIYFLWVVDKVSTFEVFKDVLIQCVERSKQPGFPTLVPLIHVTRDATDPAMFGLDPSALFKGRPDMKYTLRTVKGNGIKRHAVYCCGPSQLVNSTWEAAGDLTDEDVQFAFHHETFEF